MQIGLNGIDSRREAARITAALFAILTFPFFQDSIAPVGEWELVGPCPEGMCPCGPGLANSAGPYDDGIACTLETCHCPPLGSGCIGSCTYEDACPNDPEVCFIQTCNHQDGRCDWVQSPDCIDNDLCTIDFCDEEYGTGCQHETFTCESPSDCVVTTCSPVEGCIHEHLCLEDPNVCDGIFLCSLGTCQVLAPPLHCDDGNPCTDDRCDPQSGCYYVNSGRPCNDGDACTLGDHCVGGVCVGGASLNCDDGNWCTGQEWCDSTRGCVFGEPVRCDDGDPCTADECSNAQQRCIFGCLMTNFWDAPPPPAADDRTFVTDVWDAIDQQETQFVFDIYTTRYAGPTWIGLDTLQHAEELRTRGLAGRYAELHISAKHFHVQRRHEVYFNGVRVDGLEPGLNTQYYLRTDSCDWVVTKFQIPLGRVKFPSARGVNGPPVPQANEVRVVFDAQPDCVGVASAWLKIKVMSPIVLIHGNNSGGGFFDRQGFVGGLTAQIMLSDASISMLTAPVPRNAQVLGQKIPVIAASFGVDSVHLVAHSKGGLDARAFLATPSLQSSSLTVLSLTTLGTPHNGSILADVTEKRKTILAVAGEVDYQGIPSVTQLLLYLEGRAGSAQDIGRPDLRTTYCGVFNAGNIPALPRDVVYNTVSADADLNGNTRIDNSLDEYWELRTEDVTMSLLYSNLATGPAVCVASVNAMYQLLRSARRLEIRYQYWNSAPILATVANPVPQGNDVLVTVPSGHGASSFWRMVTNRISLAGFLGRNHSSIANGGVATTVASWLKPIEQQRGDLR